MKERNIISRENAVNKRRNCLEVRERSALHSHQKQDLSIYVNREMESKDLCRFTVRCVNDLKKWMTQNIKKSEGLKIKKKKVTKWKG